MLLFGGLKRPWNTGIILPATWELHVDNKTPPAIRRFFRLDSWFGKGSKIRLETLKPLENTGLFRFVEIIPQGHSCASLLLANGVPMKQIQEWLGHSDFSTTANVYAHLDYNSKLSSADAMVNGLKGALTAIS